jgi:hypothetical protein
MNLIKNVNVKGKQTTKERHKEIDEEKLWLFAYCVFVSFLRDDTKGGE